MAITFVKNGSNVLVTSGEDVMSLSGALNIIPDPENSDLIMISAKPDMTNNEDAIRINWTKVTLPVDVVDRNDLITKLSTDFFFRVSGLGGGSAYTPYVVPIGQIDGRLAFTVGEDVDLTKDTIAVEGKFTHTPGVDYVVTNVASIGTFTFTVAPTEQLVLRYIKK